MNISESDLRDLLAARAARGNPEGLDTLLRGATTGSQTRRKAPWPRPVIASLGVAVFATVVVVFTLSSSGLLRSGPSIGPGLGFPTRSVELPATPSPSPLADVQPTPPTSCPVTLPIENFVPPAAYPAKPPAYYARAWYGTAALWTMVSPTGDVWSGLPRDPSGFTQKTLWWSQAFDMVREPAPAISVVGTRLDVEGPKFAAGSPGTTVEADFGTAMLVGVSLPTAGCWRITASYRGKALGYVVWVADK